MARHVSESLIDLLIGAAVAAWSALLGLGGWMFRVVHNRLDTLEREAQTKGQAQLERAEMRKEHGDAKEQAQRDRIELREELSELRSEMTAQHTRMYTRLDTIIDRLPPKER